MAPLLFSPSPALFTDLTAAECMHTYFQDLLFSEPSDQKAPEKSAPVAQNHPR